MIATRLWAIGRSPPSFLLAVAFSLLPLLQTPPGRVSIIKRGSIVCTHTYISWPYMTISALSLFSWLRWLSERTLVKHQICFGYTAILVENTPSPPRKYPSELFCLVGFESNSCSTRKEPSSARITFSFYQHPQDPSSLHLFCTAQLQYFTALSRYGLGACDSRGAGCLSRSAYLSLVS